MATYAETLSKARTALDEIVEGKLSSVSVMNKTFTHHNILELQRLIDWLEEMAAREGGRRRTAVARFGNAS